MANEIDDKRIGIYLAVSISGLLWTIFLYQAWVDWCWEPIFDSFRIVAYFCAGIVAMIIWAFAGMVIAYCVYGEEN